MDDTKLNGWVPRTTPLTTQEIMREVMRIEADRRAVKDPKGQEHGTAADIPTRALEIQRGHRGPPMPLAEAVKQAQTEFNSDTK